MGLLKRLCLEYSTRKLGRTIIQRGIQIAYSNHLNIQAGCHGTLTISPNIYSRIFLPQADNTNNTNLDCSPLIDLCINQGTKKDKELIRRCSIYVQMLDREKKIAQGLYP